MKRNFVRGTLALALLLAVRPGRPGQKEIVVWHCYRGGEKAAFEKVVDNFNKAQPGKIKVTTLAVPYDAFADKITRRRAARQGAGRLHLRPGPPRRLGGGGQHGRAASTSSSTTPTKGRYLNTTLDAMTYQGQHLRAAAQLQGHHPDLQQEAGADAAEDHGRAGGDGEEAHQRAGRQVRPRLLRTPTSTTTRR